MAPVLAVLAALLVPMAATAAPPDPGRDARLVETYRAMLSEDPYQPYALRRLLEVSHAVGGLSALVETYRALVAKEPRDAGAWVVLGHLHRQGDRHDQAVAAYREAASLGPDAPGPHLAMAKLQREASRWTDALSAFDRALARLRKRAPRQEALKLAAEAALEGKMPERADGYFARLLASEPRNVFLHMEQAATLARLGHPERALRVWQEARKKAARKHQHLVVIWRNVAELFEQLGRLDEAEATWRDALARTPEAHWATRVFRDGLIGVYRRRDKLGDLVAELQPLAKRNHEVMITLARLHEELGADDLALTWTRRAIKARPKDVAVRRRLVKLLGRSGTTDQLIEAYQSLMRLEPRSPEHGLALVQAMFHRGRTSEAFRLVARLSRRHPQDPGVHQRIIDLTMRYGGDAERPRIEREYAILMRLEPRQESHVVSLGEVYWTAGDRARARAVWERLRRLGRSAGEGHFLLAEVCADHGLDGPAREAFDGALAAEPDNARFVRAYALWLEKQRQYAAALALWRRVAEDRPGRRSHGTTTEARRHLVMLWERAGRLEQETASLVTRFSRRPPDLEAGIFLAEIHLRQRRLDEALAVLRRLEKLAPTRVDVLLALEQVLMRRHELSDVLTILEALARAHPAAAYEYMHRAADVALAMGDEVGALSFTGRVISLNPADPAAHGRAGQLYQRLGRRREAAESWHQALRLDPRNDALRFRLASLYRILSEADREAQMLTEVVREASNPADVLKAGRRLLQVARSPDRLQQVERTLRPLADQSGRRQEVHRKLLIDVYVAMTRNLRWSTASEASRSADLASLGERVLKPLLDALDGTDVAVRARALEVLRWTRPPGAVPALGRLTLEADGNARFRAAVALGGIASATAVRALARMAKTGSGEMRNVALWALGLTGAEQAEQVLVAHAMANEPRVHALVALALAHHGGTASARALVHLARHAAPHTRRVALWALAFVGRPDGRAVLEAGLAGDVTSARLSAWGLGRMGDHQALATLADSLWRTEAAPAGVIAAALLSPGVRQGDGRIRDAYRAMADEDRGRIAIDPSVFLGLSRAPELIGEARVDAVERILPHLRRRFAALWERPRMEPLTQVLASLMAPGGRLRLPPVLPGPLADSGSDALVAGLLEPHLDALLSEARAEDNPSRRAVCLELLSVLAPYVPDRLPADELVDMARQAVAADHHGLARAAAEVLGRLAPPGDGKTVDALIGRLGVPQSTRGGRDLRTAIARILGAFDGVLVAPSLSALVRDPDAAIRRAAVASAARLAHPALEDVLIDRLDDPVADIATLAARALIRLDTPRAREAVSRHRRQGRPTLLGP